MHACHATCQYSCNCNYSCRSTKCTMTRHMMATASAVLQLRTQFLQVLSRPVKISISPLYRCNPPRSRDKVPLGTPMARRSIYVSRHPSCVFGTTQLGTTSTFCRSEKRRVLHGVPTQEATIFRTRAQLCRKCQQVVWSIGDTGGASSCSCKACS
jgi:hypothetical protein